METPQRRGNFKYARSKICSASRQSCDDRRRLLWRNADAPHQRQEGLKDEKKNMRTQMQEFKQAITSLLENTDNFLADSTSGACNWQFRSFHNRCTCTSRRISHLYDRAARQLSCCRRSVWRESMLTGNADLEGCARRQGHSHLQCGDVGGAARRLAGSRRDDAATDSGARACKRRGLGWTQTNR